jgi:hypothetical protein
VAPTAANPIRALIAANARRGSTQARPPVMTPDEAVDVVSRFRQMDELDVGSVHIETALRWCAHWGIEHDAGVAREVMAAESGVLTVGRFGALLHPRVPRDAIDDVVHFVTIGPAAARELQLDEVRRKATQKMKEASKLRRIRSMNGGSNMSGSYGRFGSGGVHFNVAAAQEQPALSPAASATFLKLALQNAPRARAPPRALLPPDPRGWLRRADHGTVLTLHGLYEEYRGGDVLGVGRAAYVRRFRLALPKDDLRAQFAAADRDGDGYLCFQEFARCMWPGMMGTADAPFDEPFDAVR